MTSIFGKPNQEFFLRRLWRHYILILKGSARRKNAIFWLNVFLKLPKNGLFLPVFVFQQFYKNIKIGSLQCSRSTRKIDLVGQPKNMIPTSGSRAGGGGGGSNVLPPRAGIRPSLYYFEMSIFGERTLNLSGKRATKKHNFQVQKSLKPAVQKKIVKIGVLYYF